MKKYVIIILIHCLPLFAPCQTARLLTIDELNTRISKGLDTIYVINFWATWCAPCVKELPDFEALNEHFKTERLKVLLVSVDFKSNLNTSVAAFLERKKISSEVFLLDEKNQQEYIDKVDKSWSGAIPATLFIRQNKRTFFEQDFTYPQLVKEYQSFK